MVSTVNVAGYKRTTAPKKKAREQKCTDAQAKKDQKLGFGKMLSKGLETLDRRQLNKVAKKHKLNLFGKSSAKIIEELRQLADKIEK